MFRFKKLMVDLLEADFTFQVMMNFEWQNLWEKSILQQTNNVHKVKRLHQNKSQIFWPIPQMWPHL